MILSVRCRGQIRVRSRLLPDSSFRRFFRNTTAAKRNGSNVTRINRYLFPFIRTFRFRRLNGSNIVPSLLRRRTKGSTHRLSPYPRYHVKRDKRRSRVSHAVGRTGLPLPRRDTRLANYVRVGKVCLYTQDAVCTCKVCLIRRLTAPFFECHRGNA